MAVDYITANGQANGSVASRLLAAKLDPGALQPWISEQDGQTYVTVNTGRKDKEGKALKSNLITNAPGILTREEWIYFDKTVQMIARAELRIWGDLRGLGLSFDIPNGMAKTVIQHSVQSDAGVASLSMNALRKTNRDRPTQDTVNLPLPIVHGEFFFDLRELLVSREGNMPLDTTMLSNTVRRCMEEVEKMTWGTLASYEFGGGTIYGLTNFPDRFTKTMTLPTDPAWTPQVLLAEILDMIQTLRNAFYTSAPLALYFSTGWSQYLDNDYSAEYNGDTLRNRLAKIKRIRVIEDADYLPSFQVVMFTIDQNTIQAVQGMPLRTLQWEQEGGLELCWKVMGIMIPRIRKNANGTTGIVHGVAA